MHDTGARPSIRSHRAIRALNLNLKLNLLWISARPRLGLTAEIAALIHTLIPEAKLVADRAALIRAKRA